MPCFLCELDSRSKTELWERHESPPRKYFSLESKQLIQKPLVDRGKILIPLLLMKLGIKTHFL